MSTDIKNTPVDILLSSTALPNAHVSTEFPEAGHKLNVDQHIASAGKKKGRVQIANTAGVYAMAIATAGMPVSDWNINGAVVTPGYTGNYPAPTTFANSDTKPNLNNTAEDPCDIASIPMPIILLADLSDLGHVVNYKEFSGKTKGGVVIVDNAGVLNYAIANAGLPESTWSLTNGSGTTVTTVTPTGTLRPPTSIVDGNEQKPVAAHAEFLTCVDFDIVTSVNLADLTYKPLYNDEQRVSSHHSSALIVDVGGALTLMYGNYDAGVLTWYDLGDVVTAIPVV